ncbi:hypothetical protein BGW36DRAFT_82953 [Talaromyces proteolyticus]|uniref:REJ domain-containing protein n=1 Tax=Talaromyces proteolyticus TaxID=1131652 RepID=A0AAD4KYT6_9EURO|nr:uncharacterized protein BGW36DRAFT_82953 [Talaromyces proteolyticus]KAH8703103.1 hypothetical protein BGW36DRAFT_82953 [Talaromyces proteolyticus]
MYSHFSPSFLLALFAVVLVSVNALPRPLNMHDESILTLSLSPSITPSSTPSPSFSPSQTPSTTPSSTSSSAITRSPTPKVSSIKHDSFKSTTSTSSSETVAATPLTAADLSMFSTVTGLLGGLASLMGLA